MGIFVQRILEKNRIVNRIRKQENVLLGKIQKKVPSSTKVLQRTTSIVVVLHLVEDAP